MGPASLAAQSDGAPGALGLVASLIVARSATGDPPLLHRRPMACGAALHPRRRARRLRVHGRQSPGILAEDEARQVIRDEARKEGIEIRRGSAAPRGGLGADHRSVRRLQPELLCSDTAVPLCPKGRTRRPATSPWTADDVARRVAFEVVSRDDARVPAGADELASSVTSCAVPEGCRISEDGVRAGPRARPSSRYLTTRAAMLRPASNENRDRPPNKWQSYDESRERAGSGGR